MNLAITKVDLDRLEIQLYDYKPQLRNCTSDDRQRLRQRLQQQLHETNGYRCRLQVELPVLKVSDLLLDIKRNLEKCHRMGMLDSDSESESEIEDEPQSLLRRYNWPSRPLQLSEVSSDDDADEDTRPLSALAAQKEKKQMSSSINWETNQEVKPLNTSSKHKNDLSEAEEQEEQLLSARKRKSPYNSKHKNDLSEAEEQEEQLLSARKRKSPYKFVSTSSSPPSKIRLCSDQQTSSANSATKREPIKTTLVADRNSNSTECTYHVHVPSFAKDCHISINLGKMVQEKLNCLYERVPQKKILTAPDTGSEKELPLPAPLSQSSPEEDDDALSRLISEVLVEPNAVETWRATNALDNINNNLSSNYDLTQQYFDLSSSDVAKSDFGNSRPKKRQRKNNTKSSIPKSPKSTVSSKKRGRKPNSKNPSKASGTDSAKSDLAKYVELFANDCSQPQPSIGSVTPAASSTMSQQLVTSTTQNLDDQPLLSSISAADQQQNQQQITHYLDGDWANGGPCQLVFTGNIPNITLDAAQIQQEDFTTTTAPFEDFVNYFDFTNTNAENNVIARVLDGGTSVPVSIPLSAFSNIVQNPITAATTATRSSNNNAIGQPLEWNHQQYQSSIIKLANDNNGTIMVNKPTLQQPPPPPSIIKLANDNNGTIMVNKPTLQQPPPPPPAHSCEGVLDLSRKPKPAGSLINPICNIAVSSVSNQVNFESGEECLPMDLSIKSGNSVNTTQQQQHQHQHQQQQYLLEAVETDDNFIRRLIETSDFDFGPSNEEKTSSPQVVLNESFKAALDMPLLDIDGNMSNLMQKKATCNEDVQNRNSLENVAETPDNNNLDTNKNNTKITTNFFTNISEAIKFPDQSTKTLFEELLEVSDSNNDENDEHFKIANNNTNNYESCSTLTNELCEIQNVSYLNNIADFVQLLNVEKPENKDQTFSTDPEQKQHLNGSDSAVTENEKTVASLSGGEFSPSDSTHKVHLKALKDDLVDMSSSDEEMQEIFTEDIEMKEAIGNKASIQDCLEIYRRRNENDNEKNRRIIKEKNEKTNPSKIKEDTKIDKVAVKVTNLEAKKKENIVNVQNQHANSSDNIEVKPKPVRTKPMVEIISVESIKPIGTTIIEEDMSSSDEEMQEIFTEDIEMKEAIDNNASIQDCLEIYRRRNEIDNEKNRRIIKEKNEKTNPSKIKENTKIDKVAVKVTNLEAKKKENIVNVQNQHANSSDNIEVKPKPVRTKPMVEIISVESIKPIGTTIIEEDMSSSDEEMQEIFTEDIEMKEAIDNNASIQDCLEIYRRRNEIDNEKNRRIIKEKNEKTNPSKIKENTKIDKVAVKVTNLEAKKKENIVNVQNQHANSSDNIEVKPKPVRTKPMVEIISVESIKPIGTTIIEEDDAYIQKILKKPLSFMEIISVDSIKPIGTTIIEEDDAYIQKILKKPLSFSEELTINNNMENIEHNCAGKNQNISIFNKDKIIEIDLQTKITNEKNETVLENKIYSEILNDETQDETENISIATEDKDNTESSTPIITIDLSDDSEDLLFVDMETFARKSTNKDAKESCCIDNLVEITSEEETTHSNAKPIKNNKNKESANSTDISIDLNEDYNEQSINISLKMPKLTRLENSLQETQHICDDGLAISDICMEGAVSSFDDERTEKVSNINDVEETDNATTEKEIFDNHFEFCDLSQELNVVDNVNGDNQNETVQVDVGIININTKNTAKEIKSNANTTLDTNLQDIELFPNLSLLEMESHLEQLDFDDEFDEDAVSLSTSCFDSMDEDASVKDEKAIARVANDEILQVSNDRKNEPNNPPKAPSDTITTATSKLSPPHLGVKFKIPKLSNTSLNNNLTSPPPPPQQVVTPVTEATESKKQLHTTTSLNVIAGRSEITKTSKFYGLEKITRTVQNICAVPPLPLIPAASFSHTPWQKRCLFQLPPPPLGFVVVTDNSNSDGNTVCVDGNYKNSDDDDGDVDKTTAFNMARHHIDYAKLQRGIFAGTGGEGRNRGPAVLEIAKLFGITCLPFLVDKCFALAACPLSHKLPDPDLLKIALEQLVNDKDDLSVCYRFMYNHGLLYPRYCGVFCKLYTQLNKRSKLLNMINDSERFPECSDMLGMIFYSLVQCGLNKVNACRQILSRSRDKSLPTLDCLMSIIMESDWTMFCDYIERFTQVPNFNIRIDFLTQMAPVALRLKDPHLVSIVFKCLLVLQPDDLGKVQCSPDLIKLLELMKSGHVC